jgi:hypothetical protein
MLFAALATVCVTMDEPTYNDCVARLNSVNAVISKLDPAIRSDAFALLKPYVTDVTSGRGGEAMDDEDDRDGAGTGAVASGATDDERLVEKFESDKEFENALLALAIFYGRHGRAQFTMATIRGIAREFNLDIPDRVDVTLSGMKREGNKLLRKQANGDFKVTPGGETWLKSTYGVTKGKQPVGAANS